MAWITKTLQPESSAAEKYLSSYTDKVEQMISHWHEFQEEQFTNQNRVFGYSTSVLPTDTLPEVLPSDFWEIRSVTERQWQLAFVQALQNPTQTVDPTQNLPEYSTVDNWVDKSTLHDTMFYTLTETGVTIETSKGNRYEYKFETPLETLGAASQYAPPILHYGDEMALEVYVETDTELAETTAPPQPVDERNSFFSSTKSLVNLLGVYEGELPVGVFEANSETIGEAEQVFDMLGVYYEKYAEEYNTTIYFITRSREKYNDVLKATEQNELTLIDFYELCELPTEGATQTRELRKNSHEAIHTFPGFEFAFYALQNGVIDDETAHCWPYVYYRPAFSVEGAAQALRDARDLYEAVKDVENRFTQIGGDEVKPLLDEYLTNSDQRLHWPETLSSFGPHNITQDSPESNNA